MEKNAPTLGRIVGAYKSLTTNEWLHYIKAHNLSWEGTVWQRNYHEEVIFDRAKELDPIRQYIRDNPMKAERVAKQSPDFRYKK